ncbi:MAG: hypothetical protein ACTSWE_11070 [Promethearchaeota archaeon]
MVIPDIRNDLIKKKIIDIFKHFNVATIEEIQGEYLNHQENSIKKFFNGLYIKVYLPKSDFNSLMKFLFDMLKILDIKQFLIFMDELDGMRFVCREFNISQIPPNYHPIKNLSWNKFLKTWYSSKIFSENFKPLYPKL